MPTNSRNTYFALIACAIVILVIFRVTTSPKVDKIPETLVIEEKKIETVDPIIKSIGSSVEGRQIESYSYGTGPMHVVFVGGIHGGYEWNSVLLAYKFIDYIHNHPEYVPNNVTIDILPSINPDAIFKVTGKEGRFTESDVSLDKKLLASARFNANTVDLNRNFDCKWQPKSKWQSKEVSAGSSAFSEPEARAVRDFMLKYKPSAAVFWHSQANGVYASQCEDGILPETLSILEVYSQASRYPAIKTFDAYVVTGAVEDWLASVAIPSITVELKTHEGIDWSENLAGSIALINYFKR